MNTLFILLSLISTSAIPVHPISTLDTGIQVHRHDGILNEWPKERFVTDRKSGIEYAIDNDKENMYVAMKIIEPSEQLQMMHFGMRLFIDFRGKQKENQAVEFPLRNQMGSAIKSGRAKEQRMFYATNFIALRLIGFPGSDPIEQGLDIAGSAQIAFSWDSLDIMYIEYFLPKSLFNLPWQDQKKINLGWKVFGPESTELLGSIRVPAGMRASTSNSAAYVNSVGSSSQAAEQLIAEQQRAAQQSGNKRTNILDRGIKEHKIWANYIVNF